MSQTTEFRLRQANISGVPGVILVPTTNPEAAQEAQRYAVMSPINYELFTTEYRSGGSLHDILIKFAPGFDDRRLIADAPLPEGAYYLRVVAFGGKWGVQRQAFQAFENAFALKVAREKRPRNVLVLQRIPGQDLDWNEFSPTTASIAFRKAHDEVADLGLPNAKATDDVAAWLGDLVKNPNVSSAFETTEQRISIKCIGGSLDMKGVAFHLEQLTHTPVLDETSIHRDRAVALVTSFPDAANEPGRIAAYNKALARHGLMLVRAVRQLDALYVTRITAPTAPAASATPAKGSSAAITVHSNGS